MTQSDQQQEFVTKASDALAAGQPLDDAQRRQAVGWGAKIALETGDTAVLDVFILALGGHHQKAIQQLLGLAFSGAGAPAAPADALDDLLGGGTAAPVNNPASASPPPSGPTQTTPPPTAPNPATARPGRRAPRTS